MKQIKIVSWLALLTILVMGCNDAINGNIDYPVDIEFEVRGTNGVGFSGYLQITYGSDTLLITPLSDVIPADYNLVLDKRYETVKGRFSKNWGMPEDTLIANLYVYGDFYATDTATIEKGITLSYQGM